MSRFDITLGLLASILTVAIIAVVGLNEEERMAKASVGWDMRSVENGAVLFAQYCASCHGDNAVGLNCPPLNESSGLYGGDIAPGVACRLEDLGWDRTDPYGYIVSVIIAGRQYSTRPGQFPGNRMTATPLPRGFPTPEATSPPLMAMPAWGEDFGGPLRDDQVRDIANYLVEFRSYLTPTPEVAKAQACPMVDAPPEALEVEPVDTPGATATFENEPEGTEIIGPGAPGAIGEATPAAP